jgi:hypothetical protein
VSGAISSEARLAPSGCLLEGGGTVTQIERSLPDPEFIRYIPPAPPDAEPDHQIWRNGRVWWIAFTFHRGQLDERVWFSLQTANVAEECGRRDRILALSARAEDLRISLRLTPRGKRSGRAA